MTREDLPLYYVAIGRAFRVVAEFANTDEGTKLANAYMLEHPGAGVLDVVDGRVILAHESDNGVFGGGPVRRLTCCCCGASTPGRQWHNRDEGFGLCVGCIDFCARGSTPTDFQRTYGLRGVHFDVPAHQVAKGRG